MTRSEPFDASEVVVRPGEQADLPEIAEVLLASRRAAAPAMPAFVRPDAEVRAHVRGWDLEEPRRELWVAECEDRVVAFAELKGDWLDDLYVEPAHAGRGIGTLLLDLVKSRRPDGFSLWVFESNLPARGFYARHGLREGSITDGSGNEEGAPDVEMWWEGDDAPPS